MKKYLFTFFCLLSFVAQAQYNDKTVGIIPHYLGPLIVPYNMATALQDRQKRQDAYAKNNKRTTLTAPTRRTGNEELVPNNGEGTYHYSNGFVYVGMWKNGKMDGEGTCSFLKNSSYTGHWVMDQWNGEGKLVLSDGTSYSGNWVNGNLNGHGIYIGSDGEKYDGGWKAGKWDGKGKLTLANGNAYDGEFKDDVESGTGTILYSNGDKFTGMFINNKKNGKGIHYFLSGEKFECIYKDGQENGYGKYIDKDGTIMQEGTWKDGAQVSAITTPKENSGNPKVKNGLVDFTYPNGDVYLGYWVNDKREGLAPSALPIKPIIPVTGKMMRWTAWAR